MIENRKARFEYEILDTFVAGMVLEGWEVKSIVNGMANLRASWVSIRNGELFLANFSVSPWKFSSEIQPKNRDKKLLLKKNEIHKINQKLKEKGFTIIPLKIFSQKGFLKCEIAVARGRKKYEKKQVIRDRESKKFAKKVITNFNN